MDFSPKRWWQTTKRLLVNGLQALAVSTMLLVSAVLLLAVVLICSLLMILTRNKTLRPTHGWLSTLHGLGSKQARSSD